MKLIDRYILREWFKAFLLTLSAIIGVIIVGDMFDDLGDLLESGASFWNVVNFYIYLVPSFFPVIIPISLLISLLFVLGNFHRNNEIVALQASGVGLLKITRSLWAAGLVLTLLLVFMNANVIPWSVERTKKIEQKIAFAKEKDVRPDEEVGLIRQLVFDNEAQGRLWYIHRFSEYAHHAHGVNVYVRDSEGNELTRIMAKEAVFDKDGGYWVFKEGREVAFDITTGEPEQALVFEQKAFTNFNESPEVMVSLSKKPRHLSLFQIRQILKELDHKDNPNIANYAVKYQNLLASPVSCLIVVAIAIPFATFGVRTNPMVGVSKAIALFFIYYAISNFSTILGGQQILSAWLAAWLPIILMLGFAAYLYRKVV